MLMIISSIIRINNGDMSDWNNAWVSSISKDNAIPLSKYPVQENKLPEGRRRGYQAQTRPGSIGSPRRPCNDGRYHRSGYDPISRGACAARPRRDAARAAELSQQHAVARRRDRRDHRSIIDRASQCECGQRAVRRDGSAKTHGPVGRCRGAKRPDVEQIRRLRSRHRKLVVAGKPFGATSPLAAASTAVVSGVPVAGAPPLSAVEGRRHIAAARPGSPADAAAQALADARDVTASSQAAHPGLTTAGNIAGAVAGTIPLAAEFPTAFGMVGTLPMRIGAGGLSGAALGGVDAGMRGEDIGSGALGGAAEGAVAPVAGSALGAGVRAVMDRLPSAVPEALAGSRRRPVTWLMSAYRDQTPVLIAAAKVSIGPSGFMGELTPQGTDLLGSIADNSGPGKAIVRQAYGERSANPVLIDPNAKPQERARA